MKKIAILIALPILVLSFSNFTTFKKEATETIITAGGAMVTFAGKRSGEIETSLAKKTTTLFAKYPKNGKIISYDMVITEGEKSIKLSGKGNKLTGEMNVKLKKLQKGDSIKFINIKVEYREGKSIPAPTISLKLV